MLRSAAQFEKQGITLCTAANFVARISQAKVQGFLSQGAIATSTTGTGRACEDLGEYIFAKFPGVTCVARNALDIFGSAETDLVFTNDATKSGLYFLEPVLIIECKNYATSNVSSADISYFATRLRDKGARSGIILTTTSISGTTARAGIHAVETALVNGVTILVINAEHLSTLSDTQSLLTVLNEQLVELRVSGTLRLP